MNGDLIPRNTSGIATASAGDLGSSTYPFKDIHITGDINLNSGKFTPIGTVIQTIFPAATSGYLLANGDTIGDVGSGATHESASYESLFILCTAYFGNAGTELFASGDTVLLPDLRGYFVRGWDNSRGIDSGRAINTTQVDANKAHTHDVYKYSQGGGSINGVTGGNTLNTGGSEGAVANAALTSGTESRPKNIALNYLIKF